MKDDQEKIKMEDNFKKNKNMEDDLKKLLKPQKNEWQTTSKIKYGLKHNFKKSTLIGCDIIVN